MSYKSHDQHLADENDRRIDQMCADSTGYGCPMPGVHRRGNDWVCIWHLHNPGTTIPRDEIRPRGKGWREQGMEDWHDGLAGAQADALRRKGGEGRKVYAARMAEIMRRLAKRASHQLHGRLPYDKRLSADGTELGGDRESSLERARREGGEQ